MESLKNFGNSLEGFLMKNNINYIINCIDLQHIKKILITKTKKL